MTTADAAAILVKTALTHEEQKQILVGMGLKEEEAENAIATAAHSASNVAAAATTQGLTTATVGLTTSLKGLWTFLTTTPVGWIVLASGLIYGIVKAVDAFTVSAEEAKEKMDEAFGEFEDAKQKISDVNSELETTRDRIEELEAKGGLTFVEEAELEKLREATELLRIQEDLANREYEREAKEAADSAVTSFKKNFTNVVAKDNNIW